MTPSNLAEVTDAEQQLQTEVISIGTIKVIDPVTFGQAGDRCKSIVALEKKVHEYWDPLCDGAHKTWKALVAKRAEFLDPLAIKKTEQVGLMKVFEREEERKRQEAERIAQEKARKEAEDAQIAAAAELEAAGTSEGKQAAEEIISAPVQVQQVIIPKTTPAGYGSFTKKNYKAQVFDLMALAKAVVAGQVPVQAIQANEVFLGQQARSLKLTMKYPGVKVLEI